jgi:hypothetical protein
LQFKSCGWKTAKIINNQPLNVPFCGPANWGGHWDYGGEGAVVELVVWGDDEQCLLLRSYAC